MEATVESFDPTFNILNVAVAEIGPDGKFFRVNDKFCQLLAYSREELFSKTILSITHKDDVEKSQQVISTLASSDEAAVSFEKRYITRDGKTLWAHVSATISSKSPRHMMALIEDISDFKILEEEMSNQKLRMITASKINGIGRMAAGMSHEINNPLTIVMGQASRIKKLAADKNLVPEQIHAMAEQIEVMSARIAEIISSLRSFAREGSDEPVVNTSLRDVLHSALRFSRERMLVNRIDLRVDEGVGEIFLKCRGVQLTQALLNIINNAKDAVEGKKKPIIEVKLIKDDNSIGFEIHDSGDGVPADRQGSLFLPFFTTKAIGLGTGLGLSITKDIVEQYSGQINYQKSHLGGACFKITFPKR